MEGEPKFEVIKYLFTYVDNSKVERPVIFSCIAEDILTADAKYEAETGEKPDRQNHVGCSVVKV